MRVDIGGLPAQGVPGDPTGAVFSGIAGQFQVGTTASPTTLGTSNFIFDSEDGTISAWRPGSAAALVTVQASSGAVFKGLAISNGPSGPRLYATDFANGRVDVFDGGWNQLHRPGAFVDPGLPAHYGPFGIQTRSPTRPTASSGRSPRRAEPWSRRGGRTSRPAGIAHAPMASAIAAASNR